MKAIITVGISASGKTTYARTPPNFFEISRDNYRWHIMREMGLDPCWENWKWKWEDRVTKMVDEDLALAASKGLNIIIADLNLHKGRREALKAKLEKMGWEVEIKVFHVAFDEALKRDTKREHGVGFWVLNDQWQKYHAEFGDKYENPTDLPKCAIVDIDGTAALMNGKRGPYDLDKVHLDDCNMLCHAMVTGLSQQGVEIIFLSGREGSETCRGLTEQWLADNYGDVFDKLYMREHRDMRPDSVIKRELFDAHIRGKYHVVGVLDDRPRVARMWRDLGLNVVQFGNPYVDF